MPLVALVVDDSMLVRHTVGRFLEERGFSVESATNGRDALALLDRIRPDLIITDMQMPVMGGKEFIATLKSRPDTSGIPIVIVTGHSLDLNEPENQAHYAICKDIDIAAQLEKALTAAVAAYAARENPSAK